MKEERNIISINEYCTVILPTDIQVTAMSEWELCELFGVTAPDHQGGDKGTLQERSFERVRNKAHYPPVRQVQYRGLQP